MVLDVSLIRCMILELQVLAVSYTACSWHRHKPFMPSDVCNEFSYCLVLTCVDGPRMDGAG